MEDINQLALRGLLETTLEHQLYQAMLDELMTVETIKIALKVEEEDFWKENEPWE